MIRFIFPLAIIIVFAQSCQKDFPSEEPALQDSCRITRMVHKYDSISTITFSFNYDALNRISSIVQAPYGDSLIAYYEGNSSKISKIQLIWSATVKPEIEIVYNNNNQLLEFAGPNYRTKMFYKGQILDSADRYMRPGQELPGWEIYRHYNFFYDQSASITGYKNERIGYGDSSVFEYTKIKNPARQLMFFNADDFLRLEILFPLSIFGYVDEYLLKKETVRTFDRNPSPFIPEPSSIVEYEYSYDFDSDNKLAKAEAKFIVNRILLRTEQFQFFYECK